MSVIAKMARTTRRMRDNILRELDGRAEKKIVSSSTVGAVRQNGNMSKWWANGPYSGLFLHVLAKSAGFGAQKETKSIAFMV